MLAKWLYTALAFVILTSSQTFAAKPQNKPAQPASEIFSVQVDPTNSLILVKGNNLDSISAGTLAGEHLTLTGAPTLSDAVFAFGPAVTDVVNREGNYVLNLTTSGGTILLSVYVPYALYPTPPPSEPCPCFSEWETFRTSNAPNGFGDVALSCYIDDPTYTYLYFEDQANSQGWILRTEWIEEIDLGYCEALLDSPQRVFSTQATHDACATYLRNNIIIIYTNPDPSFPVCQ